MPEKHAEIEGHIEQACEKLSQHSNPNISAVAREFGHDCRGDGMDVSPNNSASYISYGTK
jgi:hypothetical protein